MCAHGLQLDQRETGDFLKVTLIPGRYRVPALQGTGPDQQIVERMTTLSPTTPRPVRQYYPCRRRIEVKIQRWK